MALFIVTTPALLRFWVGVRRADAYGSCIKFVLQITDAVLITILPIVLFCLIQENCNQIWFALLLVYLFVTLFVSFVCLILFSFFFFVCLDDFLNNENTRPQTYSWKSGKLPEDFFLLLFSSIFTDLICNLIKHFQITAKLQMLKPLICASQTIDSLCKTVDTGLMVSQLHSFLAWTILRNENQFQQK